MQRWHFLLSIRIVRLLFSICELSVILLFSYAVFGVVCRSRIVDLIVGMCIWGVVCTAILLKVFRWR